MKFHCPVCSKTLNDKIKSYPVKEVFDLWAEQGVLFSSAVMDDVMSSTTEFDLYRCEECQLESFLPLVNGSELFYKELNQKSQYYEDDKWDFHEAIKDIKGLKKIVEIGCGPGNFLLKCKEQGLEVYGTEYNGDAANSARKKGITILSNEELEGMAESFDAVFSFHVLEHVDDPMGFLRSMEKVVRPGGLICVSVPNQKGPIKFIEPCVMNMPPHHLTRWSSRTFKVVCDLIGLEFIREKNEPLLLSNHSYYSLFLIDRVLKGRSFFAKKISAIAKSLTSSFFEYLIQQRQMTHFSFLKGMAVYVVLRKR